MNLTVGSEGDWVGGGTSYLSHVFRIVGRVREYREFGMGGIQVQGYR